MSTSPTRAARAPQARATGDVERYLRALFQRESAGAFIEVRYRHRDDMRRHFFEHTDTYAAARTIARLGLSTDVYVGVAARASKHAGGKDAIQRVWTLWADLDDVDARDRLEQLPVAPAIVIASGTAGHLHTYWPLARPVSIQAAETANRRLAAQLDADTGAVTNAATILRPPGTYSFKTDPPTPVVLERLDDELTTVYAVTAGIAADPTPAAATASPAGAPRPGEDPLRALDPAHYVSALTGQAVGRSRKISCPFHEDRTPSFHVYERPEDGYYCFGCRRHGHTAYDLASALWSLQTRGEDFLELRARLYELLLPGVSAPVTVRRRR
jgi:hypothetical protein